MSKGQVIDQDGNDVTKLGNLPNGWLQVKISDIASVNYRDPKLRDLPDDTQVTFIPMAAVDEVKGEITKKEQRTLAETRRGYTPFSEGDVLFAKITPCMENGKAAIARNLTNELGFGSTEFHVLKPKQGILAEWLFYYVRQMKFRKEAKANFSGTAGQLRVKKAFIEEYIIPFAPSSEQRRIVTEIEKQFARLDAAVANLKRVQANLERYKDSVLKAACEGRLVPQDPDDEPADALLERILTERRLKWEKQEWAKLIDKAKKKAAQAKRHAEKRPARISDLEAAEWQELPEEEYGKYLPKNDKWKEKYKEPISASELGDEKPQLPRIPDGWCWVTLNQLTWSVKDGPHYSPKYSSNGVPFLTGGNVRPWGIDFQNVKYITSELHNELSKRCKPELGDILYTKGGTTGIARVNTYSREFNVWVHVAVLKLMSDIERFYLQHALNSPLCYSQSQRYTHGVGNQDLGLTRMIKIVLPLPPSREQARIADEIDRQLSITIEMENSIKSDISRSMSLRQSILEQAFTGRLVQQDLNDEQDMALLSLIQD